MKKLSLFGLMAATLLFASCSKNIDSYQNGDESQISITFSSPVTKGTTEPTSNDEISTVSVLVFDGAVNGSNKHELLTYSLANEWTELADAGGGKNLTLRMQSTDNVIIYALANVSVSKEDCPDVESFEALVRDLKDESLSAFAMAARKETNATSSVSVNLTLRRLAARIQLDEIAVNFDGNAKLDGKTITDMSVYLLDAPTNALYKMDAGGERYSQSGTTDVNGKDFTATGYKIDGCMYDNIGTVADNGTVGTHYFHCYQKDYTSNPLRSSGETPVRLVIKGTLDGEIQYWGFDINTEGKGYSGSTAPYGVTANNIYKVKVNITGYGSDDELEDPSSANIGVSIIVAPWVEKDLGTINY